VVASFPLADVEEEEEEEAGGLAEEEDKDEGEEGEDTDPPTLPCVTASLAAPSHAAGAADFRVN